MELVGFFSPLAGGMAPGSMSSPVSQPGRLTPVLSSPPPFGVGNTEGGADDDAFSAPSTMNRPATAESVVTKP